MNLQILSLTLFVILSFGIGNIFSKLATKHIGERIVLWDAIVYALILISFFLIYFKDSYQKAFNSKGAFLQIIATSLYALGSIAFYFLLTRRPAGIVITLSSLYPAVSVIIAYVFLKESLNISQLLGISFALLAVFLLTK